MLQVILVEPRFPLVYFNGGPFHQMSLIKNVSSVFQLHFASLVATRSASRMLKTGVVPHPGSSRDQNNRLTLRRIEWTVRFELALN